MIDFSGVPCETALGRLSRLPLRLVPKSAVVPILQGPLRGYRWVVGSSTHGCWLGTYELKKVVEVMRFLKPGDVCYDIGAHAGYYTLLFSKFVGETGRVVAFEPLARNVRALRHHVALNGCGNVIVDEVALSNFDGEASFFEHGNSSMGRLSPTGGLRVRCARLDTLTEEADLPDPSLLKVDVEGEELNVLRGAERLLLRARPTVFLATHGAGIHRLCCELLRNLGYVLSPVDGVSVKSTSELEAVSR